MLISVYNEEGTCCSRVNFIEAAGPHALSERRIIKWLAIVKLEQ